MRIPRRLPNYPMGDNEAFYFGTDNDVNMYWNGTYFRITGANAEFSLGFASAGITKVFGGTATDDRLYLFGNTVDSFPYINIYGNSYILLNLKTGNYFYIYEQDTGMFSFRHTGTDAEITSIMDAHDMFLKVTGAAYLKFGVYTAGAALASDGYITIKDAAGNLRKLMVQA